MIFLGKCIIAIRVVFMSVLVVVMLCLSTSASRADENGDRKILLAQELFDLMHYDDAYRSASEQFVRTILDIHKDSYRPLAGDEREKIVNEYAQDMLVDRKSVQPRIIKLLAETYTEEELQGQIGYYRSPIGQSIIKKMPEYSREFAKIYYGETTELHNKQWKNITEKYHLYIQKM